MFSHNKMQAYQNLKITSKILQIIKQISDN